MSYFVGECCARPPRLPPGCKFKYVLPSAAREAYADTLGGMMQRPAFDGEPEQVMEPTAKRVWEFWVSRLALVCPERVDFPRMSRSSLS